MSRKKIKFVVAGYGYIGKRHAEMIGKNPDCELVAICDLRPPGNEASPAVRFFESVTDLLASGIDFDVASIATPNGLHKAHAIQLLNAGRHVLIEKPMALHKSDCEEIIAVGLKCGEMVEKSTESWRARVFRGIEDADAEANNIYIELHQLWLKVTDLLQESIGAFEANYSVAGANEFGQLIMLRPKLDPDVELLLKPCTRNREVIGV